MDLNAIKIIICLLILLWIISFLTPFWDNVVLWIKNKRRK